MRRFYDGYLFSSKGSRLYNPYSVLKALKKKEIDPYWFDSSDLEVFAGRYIYVFEFKLHIPEDTRSGSKVISAGNGRIK